MTIKAGAMRIVEAVAAFTRTPFSSRARATRPASRLTSSIPNNKPAPRTSLTPGSQALALNIRSVF